MKTTHLLASALVLGALLFSSSLTLHASGSYRLRLPQPKVAGKELNRELYSLGQQVFDGKAALSARSAGKATAQSEVLGNLQQGLPKRVAKSKNLPSLAGQLSDQQLQALQYYVSVRFAK